MVVGTDPRLLLDPLAVDEHVDVPSENAALVQDPATRGRVLPLERAQQLSDRGALDRVLGTIAGESLQWPAKAHLRHGAMLPAARCRCTSAALVRGSARRWITFRRT